MNRALRSILLCILYIFFCAAPAMAAGTVTEQDAPVAEDLWLNAYSAILLDMDTGEVLYESNADEQNYPASTTKMMTALLTLENGDPKDMVTVSETAIDAIPSTASQWGLVPGEELSVHQLLQLMLVVSASEATTVAAEYVAGDIESFVDMMNERAEELGCTGTHFVNTHGFPNSEHYSTARDLSKIAMEAMKYEEFREIVATAVTEIEPTNYSRAYSITSTNGLLPGSRYPEYDYPYAIGIKTGHTSYAGFCLVSAADKDGLRLLSVVMGTPSRESSFAQTIELFEWGYENYDLLNYGKEPKSGPAMVDPNTLPEAPDEEDETKEDQEVTPSPSHVPSPPPSPSLTPPPIETYAPVAAAAPVASAEPAPVPVAAAGLPGSFTAAGPMPLFFGAIAVILFGLIITLIVLLVRRRD